MKTLKHSHRFLIKLFMGCALIFALFPLVMTHYLQRGVEPLIESWCEKTLPQIGCKVEHGAIVWAGWRHPLSLDIKSLTLSKDDLVVKIEGISVAMTGLVLWNSSVKMLHLGFRLASVWQGGQFKGDMKGPLSLKRENTTDFRVESDILSVDLPGFLAQRTLLQRLGGQISFQKNHIILRNFNFITQGADVNFRSEMVIDQNHCQFDAYGEVKNLAFETLSTQWPQSLAPIPRTWVIENIPRGLVTHADIAIAGDVSKTLELHIKDLHGTIEAQDVEVHYLGDLPPVLGAKGSVVYDRKNFVIETQGRVADINIDRAHLDIRGLDQKDQYMAVDMHLSGPIGKALLIVDANPLAFIKKLTRRMSPGLSLDPTAIHGQSLTHLQLDFLLERDTPVDAVQVEARSELSDVRLTFDDRKFEADALNLTVNKQNLTVTGEASLNGLRGAFEWNEFFEDSSSPISRQYRFLSLIPVHHLQKWDIDLTPYVTQDVSLKVTVDETREGKESGTIEADLRTAQVDFMGWHKEKNRPTQLKARVTKAAPGESWSLDTLTLKGPECDVSLKGKNHEVTISPSHMGPSLFEGNIDMKTDHLGVVLQAKVLDIAGFVDNFSQSRKKSSSVDLTITADELIFSPQVSLRHAKGHLSLVQGRLDQAELEANLDADERVSLHIEPTGHLTFTTTDSGRFLKLWGTEYDLHKGRLKLEADLKEEESSGWALEGNFTIDDIEVYQAPLLSRLLAAASLQGMLELLTGQGITFTRSEGLFSVHGYVLTVERVKLTNQALGLGLRGTLDYGTKQLDMTGEVYPLYFINRLIANIPFIGPGLSGDEDGVFATSFAMKGPFDAIQITLNPLMTIAPGVIRKALQ